MRTPPITTGDTAATLAAVEAHRQDRRDVLELARLGLDLAALPVDVQPGNPFTGTAVDLGRVVAP